VKKYPRHFSEAMERDSRCDLHLKSLTCPLLSQFRLYSLFLSICPIFRLLPSFSLYCCSLERSCESSYITLICYVANPKGPATLASAPCTRPRVHRSMKYKYCTGPPNSVNKYYHPSTRGPNPNTLIGCREVVFRLVVVRHLQLYPATLAEN